MITAVDTRFIEELKSPTLRVLSLKLDPHKKKE